MVFASCLLVARCFVTIMKSVTNNVTVDFICQGMDHAVGVSVISSMLLMVLADKFMAILNSGC